MKSVFSASAVLEWIEGFVRFDSSASDAVLAQLTDNVLTRAARVLVEHTEGTQKCYSKGEVIVQAGDCTSDASGSMYLLESGSMLVRSPDGKVVYGTITAVGCGFGEWGLLTNEARTATIVANGPCCIRELTKESYAKIASPFPIFCLVLETVAFEKWNRVMSNNPTHEGKASHAKVTRKSKLLGKDGYRTTVHRLPGQMSQYEGSVVQVTLLKEGNSFGQPQYEVRLPDTNVSLVVDEDKLEVEVDIESLCAIQNAHDAEQKKRTKSRKYTMKWEVQNLCSRLRTAILEQGSTTVETLFAQFDTDGNGVLDEQEVLAGCRYMGIDVDLEIIQAIWSIIDTNGDGEVQCSEFVYFVQKSGRNAHVLSKDFRQHQEHVDHMSHKISKKNRLARSKNFSSEPQLPRRVTLGAIPARKTSRHPETRQQGARSLTLPNITPPRTTAHKSRSPLQPKLKESTSASTCKTRSRQKQKQKHLPRPRFSPEPTPAAANSSWRSNVESQLGLSTTRQTLYAY